MHDARLHRARSTSDSRAPQASRAPHPGNRRIQSYESEVIPGNLLPVENQVNYFAKN